MQPLLIVKTGNTFPALAARLGDFDDWVALRLPRHRPALRTVAVHCDRPLPAVNLLSGVIITGSPAMVTEQLPWMQRTAAWLREVVDADVPVLGICFGHQLLATALGGTVDWNPRGREIGTVTITRSPAGANDPLLGLLPPAFPAHVTHCQSVLTLPPAARCLATSALEPHQAFAVGPRAWGVQFHPEFPAAAMHAYLENFSAELAKERFDIDALRRGVRETNAASSLLERFVDLCRQ